MDVLQPHNLGTNGEEERNTSHRAWSEALTVCQWKDVLHNPSGFRMCLTQQQSVNKRKTNSEPLSMSPLKMNCAKMIDRKLTMEFVTNEIRDNFKLYFACSLE
jgi:hypothetical protein